MERKYPKGLDQCAYSDEARWLDEISKSSFHLQQYFHA